MVCDQRRGYSQSRIICDDNHRESGVSPASGNSECRRSYYPMTDLAAFIRECENAAWDEQIDANFAEDGRLRPVLEEMRMNIRARRLEELP